MKQTLYQILGVEPDASFEDIAIAYGKRLEDSSRAADHNALVVLNQANEILSDASKRAAYDISLTAPVARPVEYDEIEDPGFLATWGKWIAVALVLIVGAIWWSNRGSSPPAEVRSPPAAVPPTPESAPASEELMTVPGVSRAEPRVEARLAEETALPAAAPPAQEKAAVNPVVGTWTCFDPVSGGTSNYTFGSDGTLAIDATDGIASSQTFELSGRSLNLTDGEKTRSMTIEELSEAKMILNTGVEGRRLVCTR